MFICRGVPQKDQRQPKHFIGQKPSAPCNELQGLLASIANIRSTYTIRMALWGTLIKV